jgi:hypothetical protein
MTAGRVPPLGQTSAGLWACRHSHVAISVRAETSGRPPPARQEQPTPVVWGSAMSPQRSRLMGCSVGGERAVWGVPCGLADGVGQPVR